MRNNNPTTGKADKALKDSLKKLNDVESIINRGPVIYCIWRIAENTPVEFMSGNISQWGYTPDDFLSGRITLRKVIHPDDVDRIHANVIAHRRQGAKIFDQSYRILDHQGEIHQVEDQTVFIYDGNGIITHAQASISDVTERCKTEQALQETQNSYQAIFENTGTAMGIADQDRNIILGNKKMEELTGYTKEELTGEKKRWDYFIIPSDIERLKNQNIKRLADPATASKHYECSINTKSGNIKNIYLTATIIPGTQKTLVSMVDITDRIKAEEQLQKSEERLQELLAKSSDMVVVLDDQGLFKYVSPAFKPILGYNQTDLIGKSSFDFIHPDDMEIVGIAIGEVFLNQQKGIPTEFRFRRADGSWACLEALGSNCLDNPAIGGVIINAREVSERKQLEAQLIHSQKMEAIGRLSGGIAHDFNNILMGIQGYISLLLYRIDSMHPDFEKMINIQTLVQSGADLTGKLLGFARGGRYELKATDINALIAKTVNLFGRTKKEIALHHKYEKNPWTVEIDRVQMEHVILNLLVNAWQAMPQGGDIYVETQNIAVSQSLSAGDIKAGDYVKITIADTGMGMDEETKQKIFEPFFTTKEKLRGMGLGLASAFGIIKEHGGAITVASEPRKGTTFTIYLPTSGKEVPKETFTDKTILTGNEAILLIDDEASIVEVCRDILVSLGYQIFTAKSGQEAVKIYARNKDKIDLVILDMIMPGLNGGETYNQLKAINPQAKVILSTGYSGSEQAQRILDKGCHGLIQKPFRMEDLSQKIREVLDQGQPLPV
ncbi:MAG: hypothetical protein CVU71_08080 [Deltaproteobacteria bacterium HGW-Deltaproteobacteria-6]|jgi:PAS domain S-box-containing protein|nr:MAG: hypothetical protein CVU71_08080 [Deltaproteobacteria bacterium HGW-Deltaproteobacteria-6]